MDWHERIRLAEKSGSFTYEDQRLARSWVTCACGEQDRRIPQDRDGVPIDDTLFKLGVSFSNFVANDKFVEARVTLDKIEARAKEILNELA